MTRSFERVGQSLFKLCNQTLHKLGDNDFSVEHTGVRVPQRAAKLERVVKYDEEALRKVRDYLALSSNVGGRQLLIFFLGVPSPPRIGVEIRPFGGRLFFFRPSGRIVEMASFKIYIWASTEKTATNSSSKYAKRVGHA